jgi:hypothetical protein
MPQLHKQTDAGGFADPQLKVEQLQATIREEMIIEPDLHGDGLEMFD